MREKATVLNSSDMDRIIQRMAHEIVERNKGSKNLIFIGIQKRCSFSKRIKENIEKFENTQIKLGKLDITFYRDDLSEKIKTDVNITDIPFEIKGKDVILVDDVIFTGRTIRAALDAIMDFGRPKSIQLVVLIDRGHRELPIRADYVGKNLPTSLNEYIEVKFKEIDGEDKVTICWI